MTTIKEHISANELKQILDGDEKVELVDVRNFDEFKQIRLASSRLIPLPELSLRFGEIDTNKTIYVFCRGGPRSKQAQSLLKNLGISAIYLEDGIDAWHKSGYPVIEGGKAKVSIERQTRIAIGILVLLGLLTPQLWWLPWFVAIMLIFAGLSNTCLMMKIVAAMPWNKAPAVRQF